jgi:hypothetical protein
MNGFTLTQLKILVERAVRPVRASVCSKRKMREELLAHVTAVFEEELARLADEQAALERTAQRFGNPAELTGQLQESVPALDAIQHFEERFADWVFVRPCESTLRRAVRYTINMELVTFLLLFAMWLPLRRAVGECPADALWSTCPVLLISGYLGFAIGILESSIRRLRGERTRRSWLQLVLALAGSTIVSMMLGLFAYGVSPRLAFWVFFLTVGSPVVLAWHLAHAFAARMRYHEDWASLPME